MPHLNSGPSGFSESQIHQQLSLEEEEQGLTSTTAGSEDVFTETKYLLYGLDLEEQQYISLAHPGMQLVPSIDAKYRLPLHWRLPTCHLLRPLNFKSLIIIVS